jgi:hypothetical protein
MAPNPSNPDSAESDRPYIPGTEVAVVDRRASSLERSEPVQIDGGLLGLVRTALERGIAPELLQKLLDIQLQCEEKLAQRAFVAAMARFKSHAPPVLPLDSEVDFKTDKGRTHYYHATLGGILTAITPHLSQEGLSIRATTTQSKDEVTVTAILEHEGGHFESASLTGPYDRSGNKNAIQAIGSTITYLRRYLTTSLLGIGTGDVDDDGGADGAAPPARREDPRPPESRPAAKPEPKPVGPSKRATDAIARFAAYGVDQGAMERNLGKLVGTWGESEYDLLKVAWGTITGAGPKDSAARKAAARKVFHLDERQPGED